MKHIGKILPVEGYYVQLKEAPSINFSISLTHLYQPLIGMEAIMLYQTLLHEIELQVEVHTTLQTHHTLMNYLNLPLDEIYGARLKLEAIGLLKTYEQKHNNQRSYIYELQSPYAPHEFFQDDMLSQLLYHHLGEQKFTSLKKINSAQGKQHLGTEVTASFSDVFQTVEPTLTHRQQIEGNHIAKGPTIEHIDFTWLETMLKQRLIPVHQVLTSDNKQLISEMAVLYDLALHEIEKSVLWALTSENKLDTQEFKEACHDLFKTKKQQTPIELKPKQPTQKEISNPQTREEHLIARLERISPKELLEDLSRGKQASEQDMKLIRDVMTSQGLPAPVMNVLIHFVLLQTNMKLSKAYLGKIAGQWSRANLATAKEAMVFAKKEIAAMKNKYQPQNMRRNQRKEVIPDWFKDRHKKTATKTNEDQTLDPKAEQERKELAALIRQYAGE